MTITAAFSAGNTSFYVNFGIIKSAIVPLHCNCIFIAYGFAFAASVKSKMATR